MIPLPQTGHAQMDGEHHTLIHWLEKAAARIGDAFPPDEALYAIDVVRHLARSHFEDERIEMHAWGYPQLVTHERDHAQLLNALAGLRREFAAQADAIDGASRAALRDRLAGWMLAHIVEHDQPYAEWLGSGRENPSHPG